MYYTQKSATCCYCGSKTVLTLGGTTRHELKCSACGAPLSRMKALHKAQEPVKGKKDFQAKLSRPKKIKKKKKRKSTAHRLFDMAEDIFDIFD